VKTPFLLLSDSKLKVYKLYKYQTSWKKAAKLDAWIKKSADMLNERGFIQSIYDIFPLSKPKTLSIVPSDFLINEEGRIEDIHHSEKMQDMISWERIEAFAPEEMKCGCNRKDCLSAECRATYEEIQKTTFIFGADS